MMKSGIRFRRGLAACLGAWLAVSHAGTSRADDKKVLAQELFDAAMLLMKQNNHKDACPKLEESQRLDEQIGTLFYLAECQEHTGLLASAWASFVSAADKAAAAKKPGHAKEAQARADALKVRLNKLLILVPDEILKAPGFELRRGEVVVGAAQLGVPLPIDNGKHVIQVSATGRRAWSTTVEIAGESATITVSVPPLKEEPVVGPVATATATATVRAAAAAPPPDAGWSTPRKVAIALGAAGIAGVIAGGVMGGLAAGRASASGQFCVAGVSGAQDRCLAEGAKLRDEAGVFAGAANAGIIAGAVLATAGVVVWLVAPGTEKAAAATTKKPAPKVSLKVGIAAGQSGATFQIGREW